MTIVARSSLFFGLAGSSSKNCCCPLVAHFLFSLAISHSKQEPSYLTSTSDPYSSLNWIQPYGAILEAPNKSMPRWHIGSDFSLTAVRMARCSLFCSAGLSGRRFQFCYRLETGSAVGFGFDIDLKNFFQSLTCVSAGLALRRKWMSRSRR